MDEDFFRQLEGVSHLHILVLMGDFNHPASCWRHNTVGHKRSILFLERIDGNFLAQVIQELTRRGILLDLVLTKKEELVKHMNVRGNLDCSDHEMVDTRILSGGNKAKSRTTTLVFRRKKMRVKQVVESPCLEAFKTQLDTTWSSLP